MFLYSLLLYLHKLPKHSEKVVRISFYTSLLSNHLHIRAREKQKTIPAALRWNEREREEKSPPRTATRSSNIILLYACTRIIFGAESFGPRSNSQARSIYEFIGKSHSNSTESWSIRPEVCRWLILNCVEVFTIEFFRFRIIQRVSLGFDDERVSARMTSVNVKKTFALCAYGQYSRIDLKTANLRRLFRS